MMLKFSRTVVIFLVFWIQISKICTVDQSYGAATLEYCNPKYAVNCSVFTYRQATTGQLLTNITFHFLQPCGNNVSVAGIAEQEVTGIRINWEHKFCDFFRQKYILDFIRPQEYKLPLPCPVPAGRFHLGNLNLPPRKAPIAVRPGNYSSRLEIFKARSKERLVTFVFTQHIAKKNKRKG